MSIGKDWHESSEVSLNEVKSLIQCKVIEKLQIMFNLISLLKRRNRKQLMSLDELRLNHFYRVNCGNEMPDIALI